MQIVLAIPNGDLRLALELYLDAEPGLFVAGVGTEAESVRALVRTVKPDLLLMSWSLPGASPTHLIRETRGLEPAPHIIVMGNDVAVAPAALAAGATAFASNWAPAEDLIDAIRRCCAASPAQVQSGSRTCQAE